LELIFFSGDTFNNQPELLTQKN